jgi:hypothetical protein
VSGPGIGVIIGGVIGIAQVAVLVPFPLPTNGKRNAFDGIGLLEVDDAKDMPMESLVLSRKAIWIIVMKIQASPTTLT